MILWVATLSFRICFFRSLFHWIEKSLFTVWRCCERKLNISQRKLERSIDKIARFVYKFLHIYFSPSNRKAQTKRKQTLMQQHRWHMFLCVLNAGAFNVFRNLISFQIFNRYESRFFFCSMASFRYEFTCHVSMATSGAFSSTIFS